MRIVLALLLTLSFGLGIRPAAAAFDCPDPAGVPTTATPESPTASPEAMDVSVFENGGDFTIFAAASLTDAFGDIGAMIEEQYPNVSISVETAGSQTLVTQLEEGASADVLATANTSTMDRANEAGLVQGPGVAFTSNSLVIVTPADNPAEIDSIDDLAIPGINLVVAGSDVPAGQYATQALCDYSQHGEAQSDFLTNVSANVVSEEPDVRHVLTKVQTGEADAGIVYASDAEASRIAGTELNIIPFPEGVPVSAQYMIAPVSSGNVEFANAFISFVMSEDGQAVLEHYGFN